MMIALFIWVLSSNTWLVNTYLKGRFFTTILPIILSFNNFSIILIIPTSNTSTCGVCQIVINNIICVCGWMGRKLIFELHIVYSTDLLELLVILSKMTVCIDNKSEKQQRPLSDTSPLCLKVHCHQAGPMDWLWQRLQNSVSTVHGVCLVGLLQCLS